MTRQIKIIPPLQVNVSGSIPITVDSVKPVKNPVVSNHPTSGSANTETSFVMTTIKRFNFFNEGLDEIKVSFAAGTSGTIYHSIFPGAFYGEDGIDDQTITVYIQSPSASQRLVAVTWS